MTAERKLCCGCKEMYTRHSPPLHDSIPTVLHSRGSLRVEQPKPFEDLALHLVTAA